MATCYVSIELVEIRHAGADIGDDWSYDITIHGDRKVIPEASGRGRPGRADAGIPRLRWAFRLPECIRHELDLKIVSTEHDLIFDDVGNTPPFSKIIADCSVGASAGRQLVRVQVSEWFSGTHRVAFQFEVRTECDQNQ